MVTMFSIYIYIYRVENKDVTAKVHFLSLLSPFPPPLIHFHSLPILLTLLSFSSGNEECFEKIFRGYLERKRKGKIIQFAEFRRFGLVFSTYLIFIGRSSLLRNA